MNISKCSIKKKSVIIVLKDKKLIKLQIITTSVSQFKKFLYNACRKLNQKKIQLFKR